MQTCVCVLQTQKCMCTCVLGFCPIIQRYVFICLYIRSIQQLPFASEIIGSLGSGKVPGPTQYSGKRVTTVAARTGSPCIPAAVVGAVIASLVRLNQMPNIPLTRLHVDMTIEKNIVGQYNLCFQKLQNRAISKLKWQQTSSVQGLPKLLTHDTRPRII